MRFFLLFCVHVSVRNTFVLLVSASVPLQGPDDWDDSGVYRGIPAFLHLLNVEFLWLSLELSL